MQNLLDKSHAAKQKKKNPFVFEFTSFYQETLEPVLEAEKKYRKKTL